MDLFPGFLTRQGYLGWVCLLLTRRGRQIFNDVHKVQREDAGGGPQLSPCPLLSHVRIQLDYVPLGEGQLVTVLAIEIEPGHTSWTTATITNTQFTCFEVKCVLAYQLKTLCRTKTDETVLLTLLDMNSSFIFQVTLLVVFTATKTNPSSKDRSIM